MILLIKQEAMYFCTFIFNENNKYTKGDKILYESETKHGGILVMAKLNIKKGNLEEALKLTNKALLTAQKVSAYDIVYQLQEQLGDIFIKLLTC